MSDHMNTGDVSRRLGIAVTAELLESLGIEPAGRDKRATLFAEDQWPTICERVSAYVMGRIDEPRAPKPERAPKPGKTTAPAPMTPAAPYIDPDL